jgi:preprotein translocase subunit SecA
MFKLLTRIFGSANERIVRKYSLRLFEIQTFYNEFKNFEESNFEEQTNKFREQIKNGVNKQSNNVCPLAHFFLIADFCCVFVFLHFFFFILEGVLAIIFSILFNN